MDLALAIHRIDPHAAYVPDDDGTGIAPEHDPETGIGALHAWRGDGPRPTPGELAAAWAEVEAEQAAAAAERASLAATASAHPDPLVRRLAALAGMT